MHFFLLFSLVLLAVTHSQDVCDCPKGLSECEQFSQSDIVILAQIVDREKENGVRSYSAQVLELYKGEVPARTILLTEPKRCHEKLKKKNYVLSLNRDLSINQCGLRVKEGKVSDELMMILESHGESCFGGSCPDGSQPVNCFENPCAALKDTCPEAVDCVADYCGGCNAHFYDANRQLICNGDEKWCFDESSEPEGNYCYFKGNYYRHGQEWDGRCEECLCRDGKVMCSYSECHPFYCQEECNIDCVLVTDDYGCPMPGCICSECEDGDVREDGCNICQCFNGQMTCAVIDCPYCEDPVWIEGKCCPECKSECPPVCEMFCEFGMVRDENGCEICECEEESKNCVLPDGREYESGEEWYENPCMGCHCFNGEESCFVIDCAPPPCQDPIYKDDECCPYCEECDCELYCNWNHPERQNDNRCGECECHECPQVRCSEACQFGYQVDENGCQTCECVECDPNRCPELNCPPEQQTSEPGDCCERCPVDCSTVLCDLPACVDPWVMEDGCCPQCETCECDRYCAEKTSKQAPQGGPCEKCNCEERCDPNEECPHCPNGGAAVEGECCQFCAQHCPIQCPVPCEFGISVDPEGCDECRCLECEDVECPVLDCPTSEQIRVEGSCCPQCPVVCLAVVCPRPKCDEWVLVPNTCCPVCEGACVDETGLTREDGDEWQTDPCTFCYCDDGEVECAVVGCPAPQCSDAVRVAGQCCGECPCDCDEYCSAVENGREPESEHDCEFCGCGERD